MSIKPFQNAENARRQIIAAIASAVSGAGYVTQTEIDFGSTPVAYGSFTITDTSVTASSILTAQAAYVAPTGKDLDELEMDQLYCLCAPGSGSFTLYVAATDGSYLHDKFKINYTRA